jgi:hypothetical protein
MGASWLSKTNAYGPGAENLTVIFGDAHQARKLACLPWILRLRTSRSRTRACARADLRDGDKINTNLVDDTQSLFFLVVDIEKGG